MNTRNLTKKKKENFATKVSTALQGKEAELIQTIKSWEQNLDASDNAITEFSTILREIGTKHFSPPTKKKKHKSSEEYHTRLRLTNINRVIKKITILETLKQRTFKGPREQKHFEQLIKTLPTDLQIPADLMGTDQAAKWKQRLQAERKARLTKLRIDHKLSTKRQTTDPELRAKQILEDRSDGEIGAIVDPDTNQITTDPTQVRQGIADFFKSLIGIKGPKQQPHPPWLQAELAKSTHEGKWTVESDFTTKELKLCLRDINNTAAPGIDQTPAGLYKFAILNASKEEQAATRILLAITQALYDAKGTHQVNKTLLCKPLFKKRGNKLLNNIRPIALQNAVAKIPSKMLAARLTDDLHRLQALHPANEGFLKYRNTSNAINTVLNTWEDAKENNKACYCISFDISKAYDKLRWFTIEDGLTRLSIPDKFVHYALGKMQGSTFTIKTRYGLTPEFEIERSCPQGDPLSPLLFVIAMDLLQVGLHDNPLPKHAAHKKNGYAQQGSTEQIADKSYADDTLLLASSEAGLRRMNDWVNEFCNYNYISMNCEKTKLFGWNERGEDTTMTIQTTTQGPLGQTYNAVKAQPTAVHVKYLGIWMNMHLDWTKQVKKMNQMVGWHCHIIRKNKLAPETAAYIVNSHLKPKLEYRMKIIPKEYDVVKWDRSIHGAVNATINQRVTIKREALRRTLNIQFPWNTTRMPESWA
jgi:hypothetical protein